MNQQLSTEQDLVKFWQLVETKAKAVRLRLHIDQSEGKDVTAHHFAELDNLASLIQRATG